MGKKGTDGRRTSGITPTQVMNELSQHGFVLVTTDPGQSRATTAFRKTGTATQNHFKGQVYQQEAAATARRVEETTARNEAKARQGAKPEAFEAIDTSVRRQDIATSRTGKSIRIVRERDRVEVLLPVDDHMTDNALKAIQQKTGVQLSQLQQLQHKKIF